MSHLSPAAARVRPALDALDARTAAVRPLYIGRASGPEIANFGALTENLQGMARLIERPLDQPPVMATVAAKPAGTPSPPPIRPRFAIPGRSRCAW